MLIQTLLRLSELLLGWVGLLVGGALLVLWLAESPCPPGPRWSLFGLCRFVWRWFPSIVMPGLLLLAWWAVRA